MEFFGLQVAAYSLAPFDLHSREYEHSVCKRDYRHCSGPYANAHSYNLAKIVESAVTDRTQGRWQIWGPLSVDLGPTFSDKRMLEVSIQKSTHYGEKRKAGRKAGGREEGNKGGRKEERIEGKEERKAGKKEEREKGKREKR